MSSLPQPECKICVKYQKHSCENLIAQAKQCKFCLKDTAEDGQALKYRTKIICVQCFKDVITASTGSEIKEKLDKLFAEIQPKILQKVEEGLKDVKAV